MTKSQISLNVLTSLLAFVVNEGIFKDKRPFGCNKSWSESFEIHWNYFKINISNYDSCNETILQFGGKIWWTTSNSPKSPKFPVSKIHAIHGNRNRTWKIVSISFCILIPNKWFCAQASLCSRNSHIVLLYSASYTLSILIRVIALHTRANYTPSASILLVSSLH